MSRSRKRHEQQAIAFPDKNGQRRGRRKAGQGLHPGHRRGRKPGRKPKGKRAGSPHQERPELNGRFPIHIVLRVHDDLRGLRKRHMYHALRDATITVAARELSYEEGGAFRIVHISIQQTHVHLLVEADNKDALASGMQSFQISAAKLLNRAITVERELPVRRRGSVFPDRYHMEIIRTPRQARCALAYVLNNWRKHREDAGRSYNVDPYSTGVLFHGWRERENAELLWRWPEEYKPLVVYLPKTWLLRVGWLEHGGGRIPYRYVPSSPVPMSPTTRSAVSPRSAQRHSKPRASVQTAMW